MKDLRYYFLLKPQEDRLYLFRVGIETADLIDRWICTGVKGLEPIKHKHQPLLF